MKPEPYHGTFHDNEDEPPLHITEPVLSSKAYRKRWAALIKKTWDDEPVIKRILKHLNVWEVPLNTRPPPTRWNYDIPCDDDASSLFYTDAHYL